MMHGMNTLHIARETLAAFGRHWKLFLGIHVIANAVMALLLMPLYTLLTGWLILASGNAALTDEDILFFALTPKGLGVMLLLGAVAVTLVIFEIAALVLAAFQVAQGRAVSIPRLGLYLVERFWSIFRLAIRMLVNSLLVAAPFIAVIAGIWFVFLTEFDINYYLFERPPVFIGSAAAAGLILAVLAWVLLRIFAGWIVALPLVLIERLSPDKAMAESRGVARSLRQPVALGLLSIALGNTLLLAVSGGLLDLSTGLVSWLVGDSLQAMAYLMACLLLLWLLTNLAVTFLSNSVLALLILRLYRQLFPHSVEVDVQGLAPHQVERRIKVSGYGLGLLFLAVVIGAGLTLYRTFDGLDPGGGTQIIAHRGASIDAPENTLAAVEEAIRQGADYVEIDVQETAEGHIVVIHDRDLMKVGRSPLRVWDTPLSELQSVDIGSWVDPRFSQERVPTLQELLELAKDRVRLNIELKYYGNEQQFEERVVQIVREMGMEDQVVAMSLKPAGVARLRELAPDWSIGLLSSVALGDITQLDVDFFAVNGRFATRRFIRQVHDRGDRVLVWTINDPVSMAAMMGKHADGIITDLPGLAVEVREQRENLEPYERFMLQFAGLLGGRLGSEQ